MENARVAETIGDGGILVEVWGSGRCREENSSARGL